LNTLRKMFTEVLET